MPLVERTLFGERDMVQTAIDRIRQFEPPEGYYLAFSGGKDSCTIKRLTEMAGVKFDAHYQNTTVDPPEVIHFVRKNHPDVSIHQPALTMWKLIELRRMPPTRIVRYCCDELKEEGGRGRIVMTGVRWAESARRKRRGMVEQCKRFTDKRYIHPIIDWEEEHVWEFLRSYNVPVPGLYAEGWKRIGCIMCPMAGRSQRLRDAERWPKIAEAYQRAMQRCLDKRIKDGLKTDWTTGDQMYRWWLEEFQDDEDDAQPGLFT